MTGFRPPRPTVGLRCEREVVSSAGEGMASCRSEDGDEDTTSSPTSRDTSGPRLASWSSSLSGPRRRSPRAPRRHRGHRHPPDLRGRAGLATVDVADHLGVHPTTYRRLQRGRAPLSEDTAAILARLFNTTSDRTRRTNGPGPTNDDAATADPHRDPPWKPPPPPLRQGSRLGGQRDRVTITSGRTLETCWHDPRSGGGAPAQRPPTALE